MARIFHICVLVSGFLLAAPGHADPMADGLKAYGEGNYDAARVAFEAGCKAGNGKACYNAAAVLANGNDDGDVRDKKRTAFYLQGCAANEVRACKAAGDAIGFPDDKAQAAKASQAYAKACTLGDAESCGILGKRQAGGPDGFGSDFAAGRASFEAGCKGGDQASCHAIAEHVDSETGEGMGREAATPLFTANCAAGYGPSCATLADHKLAGIALGEGGDVTAVLKEAARLYKRACDHSGDNPFACVTLLDVPIP